MKLTVGKLNRPQPKEPGDIYGLAIIVIWRVDIICGDECTLWGFDIGEFHVFCILLLVDLANNFIDIDLTNPSVFKWSVSEATQVNLVEYITSVHW